jgi:hypothetical protein
MPFTAPYPARKSLNVGEPTILGGGDVDINSVVLVLPSKRFGRSQAPQPEAHLQQVLH